MIDDSPVVGTAVGALLVLAVIWMGIAVEAASCDSKARAMSVRSNYGPLQGCMVEVSKNHWRPIENLRVIDGE